MTRLYILSHEVFHISIQWVSRSELRLKTGLESSSATVLLSPYPRQRFHYVARHEGQVEVCAFSSIDDTNMPKEAFKPSCIDPKLNSITCPKKEH